MSRVETIDAYFQELDAYPHIPFVPIATFVVDAATAIAVPGVGVPLICAVIEQESGGKLVFGCDAGGLYCHKMVTMSRLRRLLDHIQKGGTSQGVGLMQLTYGPFVTSWGMSLVQPRVQVFAGTSVLAPLIRDYDYMNALEAYNDGNPRFNDPTNPYELQVAAKHHAWKERLRGVA